MSSLIVKDSSFKPNPKAAGRNGRRERNPSSVQKRTKDVNARKKANKQKGNVRNDRLKAIFAFDSRTLVPWNIVTWEDVFRCAKERGERLFDAFDDLCIRDNHTELRRTSYLFDHTRDDKSWIVNKIITRLGLDPFVTFNKWHPNYRFHQIRILQKLRKGEELTRIDTLLLAAGIENNSPKKYYAQFLYINFLSKTPPEQWPARMTKLQRAKFRAFELQIQAVWRSRDYDKRGVDEKKLEEGLKFMFPEMFADAPLKDDLLAKARPIFMERTPSNGAWMTPVPEMADGDFNAVIDEFVLWSTGGGMKVDAKGFMRLGELSGNMEAGLQNFGLGSGDAQKSSNTAAIPAAAQFIEDESKISEKSIEEQLNDMVLHFPKTVKLVQQAKTLTESYDFSGALDSDALEEYSEPLPQHQDAPTFAPSFANLQQRPKKKSALSGFLESYKPLGDI